MRLLLERAHHACDGCSDTADNPRTLITVHGVRSQNSAIPLLYTLLQNLVQELCLRFLGKIRPFRKLHGFFQEHLQYVMVECALFITLEGIGPGRNEPKSVLQEVPVRTRTKGFHAGDGHAVRNVEPPGLLRCDAGGRNRDMQSVQDALDLLFPFAGPVQRAEGILPKSVIRRIALQEAVFTILGFTQPDSQRFQCKGRCKGPNVSFHKTAGHIPRVCLFNGFRQPLESSGRSHDTAAWFCTGTGNHQFLTCKGNCLINILLLAGGKIHQRLTNLAVRPFHVKEIFRCRLFTFFAFFIILFNFRLVLIIGIQFFVEFLISLFNELFQLAALMFRENACTGRNLIFLQSHDNHAADTGREEHLRRRDHDSAGELRQGFDLS